MEDQLTEQIIACALRVHFVLGPGFLESVYQCALLVELEEAGLGCRCGLRISVRYRDRCVGEFVADMVVEDRVIIENKAISGLAPAHEAQLANYLAATGIETGLLLNFGGPRLEIRRRDRAFVRREPIP